MSEPRAYTEEEVRSKFLDHVRLLVSYWDGQPTTSRNKLDGLAFSIMTTLDGGSGLPGFIVTPNPHVDDKEFNRAEGNNWYPDDCDIAGCLHDQYYKKES
jgi:hypothetical protein